MKHAAFHIDKDERVARISCNQVIAAVTTGFIDDLTKFDAVANLIGPFEIERYLVTLALPCLRPLKRLIQIGGWRKMIPMKDATEQKAHAGYAECNQRKRWAHGSRSERAVNDVGKLKAHQMHGKQIKHAMRAEEVVGNAGIEPATR